MSGRELSPADAFQVEQAKKLLADIESVDSSSESPSPYYLLCKAEVVIAGLVAIVERGEDK